MKILDAVAVVLHEANEPLHFKEIAQRIIEKKLWEKKGKTPEASVNAALSVDIADFKDTTRFQRIKPGIYALLEWGKITGSGNPSGNPSTKKKTQRMSFTNAAERVLVEFGQNTPMHYRDIAKKVLELGWVATESKRPETTLITQVSVEIKRKKSRGEFPRFVLHGKGLIGLNSQTQAEPELVERIKRHNQKIRRELLKTIQLMPPADFEVLIGELLVKLGFEDVEVTSESNDGGIDVRGLMVVGEVIRISMAVQVKRWKNNVQAPIVQQVRGSLGTHEQGLIITTSNFSKGAQSEARRPDATPVALMDGEQLVSLLVENDIGVQRMPYELIELQPFNNEGGSSF
jgi:restriction system protein